jgi:hypothetical protein
MLGFFLLFFFAFIFFSAVTHGCFSFLHRFFNEIRAGLLLSAGLHDYYELYPNVHILRDKLPDMDEIGKYDMETL